MPGLLQIQDRETLLKSDYFFHGKQPVATMAA